MKFSAFREHRPKTTGNVFVFVCADDFLIEESRSIWAGFFEGTWLIEKLPVREFEGIEFTRLSEEARTPSLFAQSRILFVMNAEKTSKQRIEQLAELHAITFASLKIVLLFSALKPADGWAKAFPIVGIDEFKPPDTARWVVERYGLPADVARYLVESAGADLFTLHHEIEKLSTFVGEDRKPTIPDVNTLTLRSERFSPFDLDDAILGRNRKKTIQIAGAMLSDGMEPLILLSRILRVWRQLLIGKGMAGKSAAREVALKVGMPEFKAGDFLAGCRKYEWKDLVSGFRELLQLDRALKSSNPDVEAVFEVTLWKLTG